MTHLEQPGEGVGFEQLVQTFLAFDRLARAVDHPGQTVATGASGMKNHCRENSRSLKLVTRSKILSRMRLNVLGEVTLQLLVYLNAMVQDQAPWHVQPAA